MKTLFNIFGIIGLLFLLSRICLHSNTNDNNLYILHTKTGNIKANYHNSRDLNNGWLGYYDAKTKEYKHIEGWKVDSVTVISENWWTSGPRDERLKYINK